MNDTITPGMMGHFHRRGLNAFIAPERSTIIESSTDSEVTCTVRNMHSDGAELQVEGYATVPGSFILLVPSDGKAYACEMPWRRENKIGVQIKGEVPKPKWHYG